MQLIGINTSRPNLLVAEALRDGRLAPFSRYDRVRPEVKYGKNSRVDFFLEKDGEPPCYLEGKNCHLMREAGFAEFPDCVAARSAKHLYELADMAATGARAALVVLSEDASEEGQGDARGFMRQLDGEGFQLGHATRIHAPSAQRDLQAASVGCWAGAESETGSTVRPS